MFSCCASSHKSSRSRRKHSCKQQSRHTCLCCLLGQTTLSHAVWRHRACLGTCRDHHCRPETADTHGEATGPWHTSLKTVMRSKVYWRLPTFWTAPKSNIKKLPRYGRAHHAPPTNCGAKNINRWKTDNTDPWWWRHVLFPCTIPQSFHSRLWRSHPIKLNCV